MKQKILITGANGLIGSAIYTDLADRANRFDAYGLDRSSQSSARRLTKRKQQIAPDRFFKTDLTDFEGVTNACQDMDVVVHLAANPNPNASWESLLNSNIKATYNVFEACRQQGVKRIVYASSGQAVLGYTQDEPYKTLSAPQGDDTNDSVRKINHTTPTRALNPYGCTKIWGEALARAYADSHGLSILCIRFGWVIDNDDLPYPNGRDVWCSRRDAVQMIRRCITAPDTVRFDIFHAFSNSPHLWMDIDHAKDVLGYVPQDHVGHTFDQP